MKKLTTLGLLCSSTLQASEWVNFIRQTQVDSGVIWDMPVAPTGNAPSMLTLENGGALFQLWTIEQSEVQDYLLDQRLVGTYLPAAEIRIETGDPYPHVHRTRADQPFKVHIGVSGLLQGIDFPAASKKVLLEQHLATRSGHDELIDAVAAVSGMPHSEGVLDVNGTHTLAFAASSLPSTDPTAAMGEEHFVVHALPDASMPQTQIATNHVQIWPVASGTIHGLAAEDVIRNDAPKITLELQDLYPSSTTYLQLYRGAAQLGTQGTTIDGSVLVLDRDRTVDRTLTIAEWSDLLEADGKHTLEIVTITPFGTERLSFVEFMVDRELHVNAHLGSIEVQLPANEAEEDSSPRN